MSRSKLVRRAAQIAPIERLTAPFSLFPYALPSLLSLSIMLRSLYRVNEPARSDTAKLSTSGSAIVRVRLAMGCRGCAGLFRLIEY